MITYKAENEKYVVNVFTDITCGYCRKMHAEMADYNARGITFRYLAYPRSGIIGKNIALEDKMDCLVNFLQKKEGENQWYELQSEDL